MIILCFESYFLVEMGLSGGWMTICAFGILLQTMVIVILVIINQNSALKKWLFWTSFSFLGTKFPNITLSRFWLQTGSFKSTWLPDPKKYHCLFTNKPTRAPSNVSASSFGNFSLGQPQDRIENNFFFF